MAEARRKHEIDSEGDPATEKKLIKIAAETQARTTFKLVVGKYIDNLVERELTPATMRRKRWYLLDLGSPLHKPAIGEIELPEVLYLLKSIEKSGRRETANNARRSVRRTQARYPDTARRNGPNRRNQGRAHPTKSDKPRREQPVAIFFESTLDD